MMKLLLLCAITLSLITACATELTEAGSKVRLLDSAAEASKCQLIKSIFVRVRHGAESATKAALNEAADAGANAFYVVSTSSESGSYTDVVGNAVICKQ